MDMFRSAVQSLATDFRPGESIRAAKKRRHQAALTIELLRKKLIEALATLDSSPEVESVQVDLTAIEASDQLDREPKKRKKRSNKKKKNNKTTKANEIKESPPGFDQDDEDEEFPVNRRWVDLI